MYLAGVSYRPTTHGRKRYHERVGQATDREMLVHAVKGDSRFRFVWKPEVNFLRGVYYPNGAHIVTGYRLVTVLYSIK